jgi:hypothetical protein
MSGGRMSGGRMSGRVSLGGPWEDAFGCSRAVVAGPRMLVEIEVEAYREAQ